MTSVATSFADALTNDDPSAAAAVTTDPASAAATLTGLYDGLGTDARFEVRGVDTDAGTFTLAATWKLGANEWSYTTTGKAADTGDGFKVAWDPAAVAPGLDTGPLSYSPVYPDPARVLDSTGGELMTQQVVTLVNLSPGVDTAAVANLLSPIAPGITATSLQSEIDAAQGNPVTAITLRESDLAPIRDALTALPNVTLAPQTRLLTTDRDLASPTLSGLSELWQQQADAAAGWAVRARTPQGTERVAGQDPRPTTDIRTTLDLVLQRAAEAALTPITQPAAIVALQPSTGNVVAVAQNSAADAEGPIALTGLYPPGSTFKTVTVSAALQAGSVTPDSIVACPGSANIEGRRIPNDNNFDLGEVPLHTAFARSCNTTMGRLAVDLPPDALTTAAAQLGLGIDYVTPGLTTVTGSVPTADTPALRVEEGIGQGKVTASPFGMALVAAALAHGSVPAPTLVAGQPGTPDRTPPALPAGIADQVKTMMRETITDGTATQLRDIPGLLGKTGTAEFIDDTHAHGWFVGIDGDLAFAVFVYDANSSGPAVDAAGRMLRQR
ncbi:penicillin-binding protein [Nocardia otitidiscaviarum]|uniref:Penicillin-binding protein n=2 Tax=Nocardia otitidiscaviarum TaxID=1823 RepID=A0A516NX39_9NOCA|nr:penicillin-binding transpeptidase domain-containing protein [Nocardia otitidiscaviarum]MCP9619240.1 penicillin-binding transpeptidase domain-containing protein [Nocardia otitidiscaviarum]QDP83479.1 penicillin-binding protein [Nocardia otitidiscaviarum]